MKNWLLTALVALGVCALSFGAFYALNREPAPVRAAVESGDPMEWLRVEFKLTDDQFNAVQALHDQYGVVCARHCAAIMAAEKRGAPRTEVAALEQVCVQSMTEHFRRVAGLMSPEQGERYLAVVLPRVHDYDHRAAPDVRARH